MDLHPIRFCRRVPRIEVEFQPRENSAPRDGEAPYLASQLGGEVAELGERGFHYDCFSKVVWILDQREINPSKVLSCPSRSNMIWLRG